MGLGLKMGKSKTPSFKITTIGYYASSDEFNRTWSIDIKPFTTNWQNLSTNNFYFSTAPFNYYSYRVGNELHDGQAGFTRGYNSSNGILSLSNNFGARNPNGYINVSCGVTIVMVEIV